MDFCYINIQLYKKNTQNLETHTHDSIYLNILYNLPINDGSMDSWLNFLWSKIIYAKIARYIYLTF